MSLAIGAASYALNRLASLFSELSPTTAATSTDSSSTPSFAPAPSTANSAAVVSFNNSLTGSTQPSLSSQILATLMQMQGAGVTQTAGTQAGGSTDPVQNLFNAMDTDGDGTVSQSEMESYAEKAGATQGQADALYTALNPNGSSSGVTESQMASAAPAQGAMPHHRHHHHHAGGAGGASGSGSPADTLMSLLDADQSGSVSQDEFSSAVTANGGTPAQATSDFTALDSDKSGTLTSSDFATAWQNIQSQQGGGSFVNTILDAFAKANTAATTAASTSVTA